MSASTVLIFEPNQAVARPYEALPANCLVHRVSRLTKIKRLIEMSDPGLIFISASYSPERCLELLDLIKTYSTTRIIPLIFVVDVTSKLNFIPGTAWAGKVGVINSLASRVETVAVMERVLAE